MPIDPIERSEIQGVLGAIVSNGLWILKSAPTYVGAYDSSDYVNYYVGDFQSPVETVWPDLDGWPAFPPDSAGNSGLESVFGYPPTSGWPVAYIHLNMSPGVATQGYLEIAGISQTAELPDASNPLGGGDVTNFSAGPQPTDVDFSSWTWGTDTTFIDYSPEQIYNEVKSQYESSYIPDPVDGWDGANPPSAPTDLPFLYYGYIDDGKLVINDGNPPSPDNTSYDYDGNLIFIMNPPYQGFGLVPEGSDFSYTPSHTSPPVPPLPPPPNTPLPLDSLMDETNVIPDTDLDGIVQVPTDLTSLGNGTGSMSFQAQRDIAQTYLPIFTDNSGALPINGYLVQGEFGEDANDVGNLDSTAWTFADESQNGVPYAYSLDERVQINMLINDSQNHVKRIEVTRPGGNSVVFDFAWDGSTNMFSPIGTPTGINQNLSLRPPLPPIPPAIPDLSYETAFPLGHHPHVRIQRHAHERWRCRQRRQRIDRRGVSCRAGAAAAGDVLL